MQKIDANVSNYVNSTSNFLKLYIDINDKYSSNYSDSIDTKLSSLILFYYFFTYYSYGCTIFLERLICYSFYIFIWFLMPLFPFLCNFSYDFWSFTSISRSFIYFFAFFCFYSLLCSYFSFSSILTYYLLS